MSGVFDIVAKEKLLNAAKNLLLLGTISIEDIAKCLELTVEEVIEIANKLAEKSNNN